MLKKYLATFTRTKIVFLCLALLYIAGNTFYKSDYFQAYYNDYKFAKFYCDFLEQTGDLSSSCKVSFFKKSISFGMNLDNEEIADFCKDYNEGFSKSFRAINQKNNRPILTGWSMEISTPYSNGSSVAFCKL